LIFARRLPRTRCASGFSKHPDFLPQNRAVDGTRIKAVNNKDRNFTTGSLQKFIEAVDKKLEDYLNPHSPDDLLFCCANSAIQA
jgi:hypothetical protein